MLKKVNNLYLQLLDSNTNKKKIFKNTPSFFLSTHMINDENYNQQTVIKEKIDYKFLDGVGTHKTIKINPKNFLKLSDECFFNLLTFVYDMFDNFKHSNIYIAKKIHMTLTNKFYNLINEFRDAYSEDLELQDYYFKYQNFKKNRYLDNGGKLDLILKFKIISKKINNCLDFSLIYSYLNANPRLFQTWKFDLKHRGSNNLWIASEAEEVILIYLTKSILV